MIQPEGDESNALNEICMSKAKVNYNRFLPRIALLYGIIEMIELLLQVNTGI